MLLIKSIEECAGFDKGVLRGCCGAEGPYNYNASARCGIPPSTCCEEPSAFASWDGIHLTEAAYRLVVQGLLDGPYTTPHMTTVVLTDYICTESQSAILFWSVKISVGC